MKAPGVPMNPQLDAYRAAIDEFICALNEVLAPYTEAIATLARIREIPISAADILSDGARGMRTAAADLRGARDLPAAIARALLALERNLAGTVKTKEDGG